MIPLAEASSRAIPDKIDTIPHLSNRALTVLRKHGRSFHFASLFLSREDARKSARLYRFCRYIDDLADEDGACPNATGKLNDILHHLKRGSSSDPVIKDFLLLSRECGINCEAAVELCHGALQDQQSVRIADEAELLRYCYKVAGTVGLMMCSVLGASDPRARAHAIDLGIAMQLTNIARDVTEDAERGRLYLPGKRLHAFPLSLIASGVPPARKPLQRAVRRILALAESYYESGKDGLPYLPARPRLAIHIAADLYREIGNKVAARGYAPWQGRAIVSTPQKVRLGLGSLLEYCRRRNLRELDADHNQALHEPLQGLPEINFIPR